MIEAKYRSNLNQPLYIDAEKIAKLEEFARRAGGVALIAVKLPRVGWFIVPVSEAPRTKNGAIRIDGETIEGSMTLDEYLRTVLNSPLTSYGVGRTGRERGDRVSGG